MRLLLLEDDSELRAQAARALRAQAYAVDEASTLAAADELAFVNDYDAVVFDRRVPDGDAVELVRALRSRGDTVPVLLLTALGEVGDRVAGLDAGADDYLTKPFAMPELLARIRALGRRAGGTDQPLLVLGDLLIDPASVTARRGDRDLTLTQKEFAILAYLVRHAGQVVSRSELLEHCWDVFADPASNVIDVRIRLLREKLGEPALIRTVRGVGYAAEDPRS